MLLLQAFVSYEIWNSWHFVHIKPYL
jgi:hypothetical protein